jgi:cell fate (sporulation/competence/biofilm development) regulator YmcA (YheA/YmcA/DUF963 family)
MNLFLWVIVVAAGLAVGLFFIRRGTPAYMTAHEQSLKAFWDEADECFQNIECFIATELTTDGVCYHLTDQGKSACYDELIEKMNLLYQLDQHVDKLRRSIKDLWKLHWHEANKVFDDVTELGLLKIRIEYTQALLEKGMRRCEI